MVCNKYMSLFGFKRKHKEVCTDVVPDTRNELQMELAACGTKRWLQNRKRDIEKQLAKTQQKKVCRELLPQKSKEEIPMMSTRTIRKSYKGDICEDCGIHLRIVNNNSMLACFKCFKTRILPAISHAMHQEDEYSSSSIHTPQKNRLIEWLEFSQAKDYADPDETTMKYVLESYIVHPHGKEIMEYAGEISRNFREHGLYTSASNAITRLEPSIPSIRRLLLSINSETVYDVMRHVVQHERKAGGETLSMKYERSPKIASYLSGFWPRRFSASQEETIRRMFSESSPLYDRLKKPNQPNFPGGYAAWLRSTVILLGLDEFINHFRVTMTSSRGGWNDKETIRQTVCKELNWQFIPITDTPPPIYMEDGSLLSSHLLEAPRSISGQKKQRMK